MTKRSLVSLVALALSAAPATASAEGLALGVRAGTPGLGVELTKSVTGKLNLRAGFNAFSYSRDGTQDEVDYTGDLKLRSFSALADLHPTDGAFHLTFGIFYNKNRVTARATSTTTIEINDTDYLAADVAPVTGVVELEKRVAPYLGLGFGNAVGEGRRLTFTLDLGVIFQGTPRATLDAQGPKAGDAGFRADLRQFEQDINNDDLDKQYLKYYPVLSLGFAYQF